MIEKTWNRKEYIRAGVWSKAVRWRRFWGVDGQIGTSGLWRLWISLSVFCLCDWASRSNVFCSAQSLFYIHMCIHTCTQVCSQTQIESDTPPLAGKHKLNIHFVNFIYTHGNKHGEFSKYKSFPIVCKPTTALWWNSMSIDYAKARLLAKIMNNLMAEDVALAVWASWIVMEMSLCVGLDDIVLHNILVLRLSKNPKKNSLQNKILQFCKTRTKD